MPSTTLIHRNQKSFMILLNETHNIFLLCVIIYKINEEVLEMARSKILAWSASIMVALTVLPISAVLAAGPVQLEDKQSTSGNMGTTTQMTATKNTVDHSPNATPDLSTSMGNGGTATLTCYNMGTGQMETAWKLVASEGLITSVNVVTTFDNGVVDTESGSRIPNTVQYGGTSYTFVDTPAYHEATISGWCYVDFGLFTNTIYPTKDGVFITR